MIDEIVANQNVGVFLVLIELRAVEQPYVEAELQSGLVLAGPDLLLQFPEDGDSALEQRLPLNGELAREFLAPQLLPYFVALLGEHR